MKRKKNPQDQVLHAFREWDKFQRENRGAGLNIIPRKDWFERDYASLSVTSRKGIGWMYARYRLSDRQFEFTRRILDLAKAHHWKIVFVRPPVSRPLQRMLDQEVPEIRAWETRFKAMIEPYGYPFLDLTKPGDYSCNTFVDGTHMSLDCYHPMLVRLMSEYYRQP